MPSEIPSQAWYAASLVIEVMIEDDPRRIVHISTFLFRATTTEAAYAEAQVFGPRLDYAYRNSRGRVVRMIYRGLHNVESVNDDVLSLEGEQEREEREMIEIGTVRLVDIDDRLLNQLVRSREDFDIFWTPDADRDPDY